MYEPPNQLVLTETFDRNEIATNNNPSCNQQLGIKRSNAQCDRIQIITSYRHVFLLGKGPNQTRSFPNILKTRIESLADYFTKHHRISHNIVM